jgi:hypothetical protein
MSISASMAARRMIADEEFEPLDQGLAAAFLQSRPALPRIGDSAL